MTENLKTKTALVYDEGIFLSLAVRLSRDFKKVYYVSSWKSEYPKSKDDMVGERVPGIERVSDFWLVLDEVDIFIFPSIYHGDLQLHLESLGKRVWGSRLGDELERDRWEANELFKSMKLPRPTMVQITGMNALRRHLKTVEDKYIKVSHYRGNGETWHHENYLLSEPILDEMEHDLGEEKKIFQWIVEDPIKGDDVVECGYDGFSIDGKYPSKTIMGYEKKDCFDDKTEVLTDQGWKLFKDLNKTEKVYTLNISDKRHIKSEYQHPTDYIVRPYSGNLVYIEKDSVSLCITPTHNVLFRDTYQLEDGEGLEWTTYRDNQTCYFKRGGKSLTLKPIVELIEKGKSFQLFQPTHIYISPSSSKFKIQIGPHKINKKDFAEFLGWYLSEGHTRRSGAGFRINISQYKYVNELESALKKMPFKFTKGSNGFDCYDRELGAYLIQFGLSQEKFIPDWIKTSTRDVINAFLTAFCYGDGSFMKKFKKVRKDSSMAALCPELVKEKVSRGFYTSSVRLRDDLQELLLKVGSVSVYYSAGKYFDNTKQKEKELFYVQEKLINRKNHIFPRDIQYMPYNGNTYCVTVPNGIIMIRRNGKAMWCGNCGYIGRVKDYASMSPIITDFNTKIASELKNHKYRNFFSTEIRVGKDKVPYMIDATMRLPSPDGELYMEMVTNLAEIMWYGSEGILVEPEFEAEYGIEVMIDSEWAKNKWQAVHFPMEIERWVKLRNYTIIDGTYCVIPRYPDFENIGAVVAMGASVEECIGKVKGYAEQIKGYGVEVKLGAIDKLKEIIAGGEKIGLKF